jgi:hypothetical protein
MKRKKKKIKDYALFNHTRYSVEAAYAVAYATASAISRRRVRCPKDSAIGRTRVCPGRNPNLIKWDRFHMLADEWEM